MNKSKKKIGIIIAIVIVAILAATVVYYFPMIRMMYATDTEYKHRSYVGNFNDMKEDYQRIADYVISDHEKTLIIKYSIRHDADKMILKNLDKHEELELSKEDEFSLRKICEEVESNGAELRFIKVEDEKIIFMTSKHDYVIVYAQDGKKPKNITNEDEKGTRYHIEELGGGWYTVSSAPPFFS